MEEQKQQVNYTIAEMAELPSGGKIYEGKNVNPKIDLRSMNARDEMKRCNPSPLQFRELCNIVEGCMLEKPAVHVYDMALGDYEYLLHKLRIISYGPKYKMWVKCPTCLKEVSAEANLDELVVKPFDIEKFKELSTVRLPDSGDSIVLKYQTPRMIDEFSTRLRELERKYPNAEIDFTDLVLLCQIIDTVNGVKLAQDKLEAYINKLTSKDMLKIRNAEDVLNASIGLDTTLHIDCPECGGDILTFFRIGQEFFRPTNI